MRKCQARVAANKVPLRVHCSDVITLLYPVHCFLEFIDTDTTAPSGQLEMNKLLRIEVSSYHIYAGLLYSGHRSKNIRLRRILFPFEEG